MRIVEEQDIQQATQGVESWFARTEGPALSAMTRVSTLRARADGRAVALLGVALRSSSERSERRIRMIDPMASGHTEFLDDASAAAWLGERLITASDTVRLRTAPDWDVHSSIALEGTAQQIVSAPDTRRAAIVLAPEQHDNWDTAPVPDHSADPYSPAVYLSGPERPRELWILDSGDVDHSLTRVDVGEWNIWECAWVDDRTIAVIASEETGETGWYHPVVASVTLPTDAGLPASVEVIYHPDDRAQLAGIVADPGTIAVIEGISSDRGLTAGRIVFADDPGRTLPVDADVTHLTLRGTHLGWAGLRGLRTVAGLITLHDDGSSTGALRFEGRETFGSVLPALEMDADSAFYAVVESYDTPPRLERFDEEGRAVLHDLGHAGSAETMRGGGICRDVAWTAPDGLEIEGLLVTPDTPGPHPLLMIVHGGPVAAWRERWGVQNINRHPYAGLLAETGIATFYPNPRGSVGRGQDFVRHVRGDMCGADVGDLLSGIDHLADAGLIDPSRVGVTGNSYGGTMSAWLSATTDRFAVAIVTSPAADMVSQHHLSNIPAFDELFVAGRVEADAARYLAHSPVSVAHRSSTPTLITAGGLDKCTPPSQAVELHQAIRRAGGRTELVIYPRQAHGIADFPETVDFMGRLVAWSRRFLLDRE